MQRYNITTPKKYTKNGEEKTIWNTVGTLVKFEATGDKPESYILELNMFPDTKFGVFEAKPKQDRDSVNNTASPEDPESIPF